MSTTQKVLTIIIVLALLVGVYWYVTSTSNDEATNQAELPNPASIHCVEELGGTLEFREVSGRQIGICNLPDGRQCEEWELFRTGNCTTPWIESMQTEPVASSSDELAEQAGLNFILDVVKLAPADPDPEAASRIYERLSTNAKETVTLENLKQDILQFIGLEDFFVQGISIEDLQIESDTRATLIFGLNYADSLRILRGMALVFENGVWKVDKVYALEPEQDKGG